VAGEFGVSVRSVRRLFARFADLREDGIAPDCAGRRPITDASRAEQPHQTWQMDAKERITLADGRHACWLTS